MVYANTLTTDQIRPLIVGCFSDLALAERPGFMPSTNEPDLERIEQECARADAIWTLQQNIECATFTAPTIALARESLDRAGCSYDALSEAARCSVNEGIARAQIEAHSFASMRIRDRFSKYKVVDPLLKKPFPWRDVSAEPSSATGPLLPSDIVAVGPKLGELVERYLKAKRTSWVAKTYRTISRCLDLAVDCLGKDTPAASITPQQVRELRDGISRFRVNHHMGASKTFVGRQTEVEDGRITPKTASVIFAHCTGLFRWAKKNAYLNADPADGLTIELPKGKKGNKARLPFSKADLERSFSAPLYRGCLSRDRRYEPGSEIISDAKYWVPIVAYLTGARLSEIIQLQIGDVHVDADIPYLDISETGGGDLGSGTEKHVKSAAGIRQVPLHPDLMKLGFREFVVRRAQYRKGEGRLFFEVGYGADGMPSTSFSKWFGRFLDTVGLTDTRLVFHSYRHGMEDALKNASQPQYVIDRLIGHTDGKVSSEYGVGVSLEVAYAALKAAKLPLDLADHLQDFRPDKL